MSSIMTELQAMQAVADATAGLTTAQKMRVALWLYDYAEDEGLVSDLSGVELADDDEDVDYVDSSADEVDEVVEEKTYDTFADLYDGVSPRTGLQKVACAAYWLERREGRDSWQAFDANKLLKQIDVKISSISIVLSNGLKNDNPLVELVSRNGDGPRSRKTFRLTDAGVAYVEDRLS